MRVGVVAGSLPAQAGGGFTFEQEVLEQLLNTATESEHSFTILGATTPRNKASLPANVEIANSVPTSGHPLAALGRRLGPAKALMRRARAKLVARGLANARVDLVWNLWPFHPVSDAPFITIVWDLQHRLQPFFPEVSAGGEWLRRERDFSVRLRRAAAIIAGTETGRSEIADFYQVPLQRIHVLPHPTPRFALDPSESHSSVLTRFNLPRRYIFYPAQFWAHKNHTNLLLALKLLKGEGVNASLVFAGSDKGTDRIVRQLATSLGLAEQVKFLGFVSTEELVALYRNAGCLSYVSLFGPENLPPLEAFALSCPVVAADVPGAREQLGEAALLVDATNPQLLAQALHRVLVDSALREQLISRGRQRAREWTGTDFVRGVYKIIDGLAPLVRCWRPI